MNLARETTKGNRCIIHHVKYRSYSPIHFLLELLDMVIRMHHNDRFLTINIM